MNVTNARSSARERLHSLAATQHELFTWRQAKEVGLAERTVRAYYERVEPRVYRTRPAEPAWVQALHAACLSAGPAAVGSHRSAAALWRLDGVPPGTLELSVLAANGYRRHAVHRVGHLAAVDVTRVDGIPVTALARTLVDLGAVVGDAELERAVESALRQGLSLRRLEWRLDALCVRGRPGPDALRRVLHRRRAAVATESELETRFVQLVRDAGLPQPERQYEVRDGLRRVGRIDFAYPERRLAIELDGYGPHADRFQSDRTRQNRLVLLGWTVLRFTSADVVERPDQVAAALTTALAA